MGSQILEAVREAGEGGQGGAGIPRVFAQSEQKFEDKSEIFPLEATPTGPWARKKGATVEAEFALLADLDPVLEGGDGAEA